MCTILDELIYNSPDVQREGEASWQGDLMCTIQDELMYSFPDVRSDAAMSWCIAPRMSDPEEPICTILDKLMYTSLDV